MKKTHLMILLVVVIIVIVGIVLLSSKKSTSPEIPPGMVVEPVTGESIAPPVVVETEYRCLCRDL